MTLVTSARSAVAATMVVSVLGSVVATTVVGAADVVHALAIVDLELEHGTRTASISTWWSPANSTSQIIRPSSGLRSISSTTRSGTVAN